MWNWKSALMSAVVRGALFFFINVKAGLHAAIGAMMLESAFYVIASGFYGGITQAFRRFEPAWAGTMVIIIIIPTINHTLEYAIHKYNGTQKLSASIIASIILSALSTLFTSFAMRRGSYIAGAEGHSFTDDMKRTPYIIVEFLTFIPYKIHTRLKSVLRTND